MFRFLGGWHPAFYMMIAVVAYSAIPVLFKLGDADESPFLFTGIWHFSVGIGVGLAILQFNRKRLFNKEVYEGIKSECKTGLMLASVVGRCGYVSFALGLVFVDVSIAAILFETWPLFLILLMSRLFKASERYDPVSLGTFIFVGLAIAGVVLVTLSQNDSAQHFAAIGPDLVTPRTLLGAAFVLIAAICAAMDGAGTLKMGDSLSKQHWPPKSREAGEVVFATVMTCLCSLFSGGLLCVIGWSLSEAISLRQLYYAIMSGIAVYSIGGIAFRAANSTTDDLGVNTLAFATPLVALIWLWMFSVLGVPRLDYLIIGAMGIVVSNLLINVKASERVAYKALVVSLWVFGTVVYFHEGYATEIPLELPVTIFILVLAFRVDRLVRRTGQEEEWVFDVFHRLESLASERQSDIKVSNALMQTSNTLMRIDKYKTTKDLTEAYEDMVEKLERARAVGIAAGEIMEIRRLVDKLAHSRQQGSRFGETVAIALTGGLIVTGLLFFNGDRELYGDITSFLLSSVVVFLFFNIVDLQRDRKDETLIVKGGRYIVNFEGVASREKQQVISVVTSAVIVIVFGLLYAAA